MSLRSFILESRVNQPNSRLSDTINLKTMDPRALIIHPLHMVIQICSVSCFNISRLCIALETIFLNLHVYPNIQCFLPHFHFRTALVFETIVFNLFEKDLFSFQRRQLNTPIVFFSLPWCEQHGLRFQFPLR